jgi:hypothetical protein
MTLVIENNDVWNSRTIAAFPKNIEEYQQMQKERLPQFRQKQFVRDMNWLREHGVCADNIYMEESTITQAGHGAFAVRPLKSASVILPVPLIHIPNREMLEMYEVGKDGEVNRTNVVGYQLLLNYCLGHRDSTMLLSPYGPGFSCKLD